MNKLAADSAREGLTRSGLSLSRRNLLLSWLSSAVAAPLLGQDGQGQPPSTFSTDVKVVNVFATVRDKSGKIVRNLTKSDFALQEDGRPQTIRYFEQQSNLPLVLGLLVDTSGSERRMIPEERDASEKFFEKILRPDRDKAFLIHFDREVELLQDLTSSRERLEKALSSLQTSERDPQTSGGGGGGQSPGSGGGWGGASGPWGGGQRGGGRRGGGGYGRRGGGTTLYDAILLSSNELMSKQTGRKAIVLLTDGEDNGSKTPLEEAVGSAQRSDTLAYSVRIADQNGENFGGFGGMGGGHRGGMGGGRPGMNRPDGKKVLERISLETGGSYFEVSKKKTVEDIYASIEEDLRNQYSIGYTSDQPASDGAYRKIQLTTTKKGLTVQARQGYYSKA